VKFTQYFFYTRQRPDRAGIKMKWIETVYNHPLATETQQDGRIRRWGYIAEVDKYLRLVLLQDGKTIHNAFLDRDYKGPKP